MKTNVWCSLGAALVLGFGCGGAAGPPEIGTSQSNLFAQPDNVYSTAPPTQWESVGQPPSFAMSAASLWSGRVDLFYRDQNYCLQHVVDTGGNWSADTSMPPSCNPFAGPPSVASWGPGRLDLFWFSYDWASGKQYLQHRALDNGNWWDQTLLATQTQVSISSRPAVTSWGYGHLDIFWADNAMTERHVQFDRAYQGLPGYQNGWTTEQVVSSWTVSNQIAGVSWGPNRIDLFWRDFWGNLVHQWWTSASAPTGIEYYRDPTGGYPRPNATPAVTSWGPNHVNLLYGTPQGLLSRITWDNGTLSMETLPGGPSVTGPLAAASGNGPHQFDLFQLGSSSSYIQHTVWHESLPGFQVEQQEQSNWCWGAVSAAVIQYFQKLKGITPTEGQCLYVQNALGIWADCCGVYKSACNQTGSPTMIFDQVGVHYTKEERMLSLGELQYELLTLHTPVIFRLVYPNGNDHFIIITDVVHFNGDDYLVIANSEGAVYQFMKYGEFANNPGFGVDWVWHFLSY